MRGRARSIAVAADRRPALRWLAAGLVLALAGLVSLALGAPRADASSTVKAQLSLTGLASADNPAGGSRLGIHPGDRVQFSSTGIPTAGLSKLGLGSLGSVLGGGATFQVKADFSHLPGGAKNTVLTGTRTKTISFANKGTYNFTWEAEKVTTDLLGNTQVSAVNLNGNQLSKVGAKLNASNQYVGQIVVATNPPQGGIGIQIPKLGAHPSVSHLPKLPGVTVPGVNGPTIHTSVPKLNPGGNGNNGNTKSGQQNTAGNSTGGGPSIPDHNVIPVPAQVVPQGDGGGAIGGAGGGAGAAQDGSLAGLNYSSDLLGGSGGNGGSTGTGAAGNGSSSSAGTSRTIGLASRPSSTGQLPVLLAIVAIIALSLVAATYARLFLLRRQTGR